MLFKFIQVYGKGLKNKIMFLLLKAKLYAEYDKAIQNLVDKNERMLTLLTHEQVR